MVVKVTVALSGIQSIIVAGLCDVLRAAVAAGRRQLVLGRRTRQGHVHALLRGRAQSVSIR